MVKSAISVLKTKKKIQRAYSAPLKPPPVAIFFSRDVPLHFAKTTHIPDVHQWSQYGARKSYILILQDTMNILFLLRLLALKKSWIYMCVYSRLNVWLKVHRFIRKNLYQISKNQVVTIWAIFPKCLKITYYDLSNNSKW